jgi:heterotetrameric sarcosine oxidase gamma subunit
MLKRYSALDSNYFPGKYPFDNSANIILKECNNLNLQQIACWPHTLSEMGNFFQRKLNINSSPNFNEGIVGKEFSLWRMEPLKWWVLDKNITLPENLGTSLDMSHAFTCIDISGKDTTLLLNRHLPLDLRDKITSQPSSFSSAIHHVSIKLLKYSNDNYYLFIPRGFALSIWEILLESSKQFGYEILER